MQKWLQRDLREDCFADRKNVAVPTARLARKQYKTKHEKRQRRTDAEEDSEKYIEGEGGQKKIASGMLASLSFL